MTPTEQALTDHLAEKVCRWIVLHGMFANGNTWRSYRTLEGSHAVIGDFDPLHDPRDTAIVMKAWKRAGNNLEVRCFPESPEWECDANAKERASASWPEAVCQSIGAASGFDKEGK